MMEKDFETYRLMITSRRIILSITGGQDLGRKLFLYLRKISFRFMYNSHSLLISTDSPVPFIPDGRIRASYRPGPKI